MLSLEQALAIRSPAAVAWSPDGSRLAFEVANPTGAEVMIHDLRSGETRSLAGGLKRPGYYVKESFDLRWTADGERVVYSTGKEYYTLRVGGGDAGLLVSAGLLGDQLTL